MAEDNNLLPEDSNTQESTSYENSIDNTSTEPTNDAAAPAEPAKSNEEFMGFAGFGDIEAAQSIVGREVEPYAGYILNPTDVQNRYYNAAVNQGVFSALGNGLQRGIFGEVIGGTIEGFGALMNKPLGMLFGEDYSESNFLEDLGSAIREGQDENTEIFERNQGMAWQFGDAAWWAKNTPSMLSTISMMLPGGAVAKFARGAAKMAVKGAGKAAKAAKMGEEALKASRKAAAIFEEGAASVAGGVAMRHAENMREAHGAFEQARADFLNDARPMSDFEGTTGYKAFVKEHKRPPANKYELADYIGGTAAKVSYQFNSKNLAFDILQMHMLGKALKGTRGRLKGTKADEAAGKLVGRKAKFSERGINLAKFGLVDMGSEGVEELVNYMGTEEGMYQAKRMMGRVGESTFMERYQGYVQDDHFWESGFLGAIGGGVFTGVTAAAGYHASNKAQKEMMDAADRRSKALKATAELAKKAQEGGLSASDVADGTKRQMYDMGLQAAMTGQSDVAEQQLAILEHEMKNNGATDADIKEMRDSAAKQFKLAEEAVAEANLNLRSLNLTDREAAIYRQQFTNARFAEQGLADMREEIASQLKDVKDVEGQRKDALVQLRDELTQELAKAKDDTNKKNIQEQLDAVNERIEEDTEGLTTKTQQELKDRILELADQKKEDGSNELTDEAQAETETLKEELKRRKRKLDDRVVLDTMLELQQEQVKQVKANLTSAEGLDTIREAAKKLEEEEKKQEDKNFDQWLRGTNNEQELRRALAKEENETYKQKIQDKLDQLELARKNGDATGDQLRSKDIVVPGPVQSIIDQLLENSDNVALNEDGSYYVDKRTGKRYMRTTTWINGGESKSIPQKWGIPASNIGNSVDEFVRDYMDGALRSPEAYPHITEQQYENLKVAMAQLESEFVANGEKVIAKDVVLFNDMEVSDPNAEGVAGTVDLLTVDKDGNFRVYDMKTVRRALEGGKIEVNELTGDVNWSAQGMKDKGVGYQKQLSTYRMMLMNQFGVNVPNVAIIPFDVMYTPTDKMSAEELQGIVAEKVNYLGGVIEMDPLTEINGMTEPTVDGVPDEDTDGTPDPEPTQEEKLRAKIAELNEEIANLENSVKNLTDQNATGSLKFQLVQEKLEQKTTLRDSLQEQLDALVQDNVDDDGSNGPQDLGTIEAGAVAFPISSLVNYFSTRLKVDEQSGREGHGYLVHTHKGPMQLTGETLAQYQALQGILNGTNTAPVTFRVVGTQAAPQVETLYSGLKGVKQQLEESGLAEEVGNRQFGYRAGKGDTLQIEMYVGDVKIGTVPTAGELMQAAQERGQANLDIKRKKRFGTGTRKGDVRLKENTLMSMAEQQAHIDNAIAMHELRTKIYEFQKENPGAVVTMEVSASETGFGQTAQGSLIYSTTPVFMNELGGSLLQGLKKHGWGLQLPNGTGKAMQVELAGSLTSVPTYGSNEERGRTSRETSGISRWNSGALYIPLENNGQVIYVKVPGQKIKDLRSGEKLVEVIVDVLENGDDVQIEALRNILGSNALEQTDTGWKVYSTNQNGAKEVMEPIAVLDKQGWTVPPADFVGDLNFDVAASVADGASVYQDPTLPLEIGTMYWDTMADFIADQVNIGVAPVTDENGDVTGWTHPLAPAYPFNDGKTNGSRFTNEDANMTQVRMTVKPVAEQVADVPVKKVSDRDVSREIIEPEPIKNKEESIEDLKKQLATAKNLAIKFNTEEQQDRKAQEERKIKDLEERIAALEGAGDQLSWLDELAEEEKNSKDGKISRFLTVENAEASENAERATDEDMALAEEWWQQNLPGVPFKRVKGIIRRHGMAGYGIFHNGAVEVSNLAVKGTEYHEAFHAVMEMFLPEKRHNRIMADAAKIYGHNDMDQLHEDLAEDFRRYMLSKGLSNREKTSVRRFFSELMELINGLLNSGFKGARQVQLFQQINGGKFAKNLPDSAKKYATRNKLIMDSIPEYTVPVQNELESQITGHAFLGLRRAQRGEGSPKTQAAYDELVRLNKMTNDEALAAEGVSKREAITRKMIELAFVPLMNNARGVLMTTTNPELKQRYSDLFGKNRAAVISFFASRPEVQKKMLALVNQEFTAGTSQAEQQAETFEMKNPKDSLSGSVKSLIETTPKVGIQTFANAGALQDMFGQARMAAMDGNTAKAKEILGQVNQMVSKQETKTHFGLPQLMQVDEVFPYMSHHLANAQSPQEMFDRLYEMGNMYPEFRMLALRLQTEEAWVQSQFFNAFKRGSTAELVVDSKGNFKVKDVFENALANANRSSMQVAVRDLAQERGETEAAMARGVALGVAQALKRVNTMSNGQFTKQAVNILQTIGFSTMDPVAMERVISMKAGDPEFRKNLYEAVQSVAQKMSKVIEAPEGQNETFSRQFNNAMTHLSSFFAEYDMGNVATTFQNVEGSRIFSKQIPSFITEWFDQFHLGVMTREQLEAKLREEVFADERMYNTTFGRILFRNGKEGRLNPKALNGTFRAFRVGGFERSEVKYTDMTDAQWYEYQLKALETDINGMRYFPVTTPSDASNSYLVPALRYDTTVERDANRAKMHLRDIIKNEFEDLQQKGGTFSIDAVNEHMYKNVQREDILDKDGNKTGKYKITETVPLDTMLDEMAELAYQSLMKEGEAIARQTEFKEAVDRIAPDMPAEGRTSLAQTFALSGYISHWSVGVALAGTHNEFKNTVDMQKRHKHIQSPGVAPSGKSGRTHFRSVTMEETTLDLQKLNEALPDDYKKVDVADAQSYVSPRFYKDILLEHGDLLPEVEAALDKAIAGETLDPAEIKLLRPYKPFYYARVYNKDTGRFESQQIKNSIIPVIKGISPDFDAMHDWMNSKDNQIDQVQMNSAHKVGNDKSKQVSLRNEDGSFKAITLKPEQVYTLPMKGYRKQVNVTDHWHSDSKNNLPSQLEKIVVANAVMNMGERGREIAEEFLDTLDKLYAQQLNKIEEKFGVSLLSDKNNPNIEEIKQFLLEQLDDGTTPAYVLELIRDGALTAPAVVNMMRGRIFTMMENEVNSIKVAGGTQVQVSSQFFRRDANRLRGMRMEDGKVMPAEIAVSRDFLPKKYRDMSIEEIKATAPEVLESITLRIPSESLNSGTVVTVVEFLPEGVDGVIVPDEFVTQMGSDFDVDKLFFQFKAGDNSLQDKMFDLQREVFMDQRNLKAIMAPQGFDQWSAKAKQQPLRSAKQEEFIKKNPMSVATHTFMRGDNMAGVSLKGQAANKNVILLDLIRYGWKYTADEFKIDGKKVEFDFEKVDPNMVRIHAEAVAAAMDGAKDPVYGKLGINNDNFNLVMEIVMMSNGDLDLAIEIAQSEPVQLMSQGHINIAYDNEAARVSVVALTDKGKDFVMRVSDGGKQKVNKDGTAVNIKAQPNFTTGAGYNQPMDGARLASFTSAIGTWRGQISPTISGVSKVVRIDKMNVRKDIEKVVSWQPSEKTNYGVFTIGFPAFAETASEDFGYKGSQLQVAGHDALKVKRTLHRMTGITSRLLLAAGDGFLRLKEQHATDDPFVKGMTMQQYDAFKRFEVARKYTERKTYTAMGERDTRAPQSMPEALEDMSLEQHLRMFRGSDMLKENADLALVVSKLVVQPNPYNVRGTYFDNITLVGISDDGEVKLVSDAMDRLDESGDEQIQAFLQSLSAYEAQRSRYNNSQSRLTRILPTRIHKDIAALSGANGTLDIVDLASAVGVILTDRYNPNVQFLAAETVNDAIIAAETKGKAMVYRTVDDHVVYPIANDPDGGLMFAAVKTPNAGQNFSGKTINNEESFTAIYPAAEKETAEDRLGVPGAKMVNPNTGQVSDSRDLGYYSPEMAAEEKITLLQERFRRSGIAVTVVMDPTLPVNGRVVFDKGTATVRIHPDKMQGDTIAHEFGHILLEALGIQHPLVQQAITELQDSELWKQVELAYPDLSGQQLAMEVVTTAIGRKGERLFQEAKKQNKFKTIYNRIMRAIGKLLGIQPKATEQLAQELMFGNGELSLDAQLQAEYDQRGTQTASDVISSAKNVLWERLTFLKKTGGTSVQAQEAIDEAQARYDAATGGLVEERLTNLANIADDIIGQANETVEALEKISPNMRTKKNLTSEENAVLNRANNVLNDVEGMLTALDNMERLQGELDPQGEKFMELQSKIDGLREAKNNLTGEISTALSNKLKAQSTNKAMLDILGEDNMFLMANNDRLRHLMTDVDMVTQGTLGVKEFQNPVMQAIAKMVADTLETGRLDGKNAEAKVAQILNNFNGNLEDIIDFETGTLKGEYSGDYYTQREKARKASLGEDKQALVRFDANNTIQEFTKEYYTQWQIKEAKMQELRKQAARAKGLMKSQPWRSEHKENYKALRAEILELMKENTTGFFKYHSVEVSEGFDAALAEARAKQEAAEKLREEKNEFSPDLYAVRDFMALNGVVTHDGKAIPTTGEFATVSVKEEFKNESWTGENKPSEKFRDASFEANPHKETIKALRDVMAGAAGKQGAQFIAGGYLPIYKTGKEQSLADELKGRVKKGKQAAKDAVGQGKSDIEFAGVVQLDARGNRIYMREDIFKLPTDDQITEQAEVLRAGGKEELTKRLKQFVKDAHTENAKRTIEPFAYLAREVFEGSQIIDAKHAIRVGKKGNNLREATKLAKGTNIADAMDSWFEGILGDNWEDSSNKDGFVSIFQQYTSLMGVGLNISAWVNNFGYGTLQRNLERAAAGYMTKETSKKAHKLLNANLKAIFSDLWSGKKGEFDNKISAIIHTLDVADDQRELPFNMKESMGDKAMSKAFIGQTLGEVVMQNQVLLGMMMEQEVYDADGNVVGNMLDAYVLDNGMLTLKEGLFVKEPQTGKMVTLDNNFVAAFRNKVKSINHHIHGAYNKQDAGTWQRHWLGRLAMQFRRWLPMGIKKRFGADMYNESRERQEVGDYRALYNIATQMKLEGGRLNQLIQLFKKDNQDLRDAFGDHYVNNAQRAIKEMVIGLALFFLIAGLYMIAGFGDDDEPDALTAFAINRTDRLREEMWTYTPMGLVELFNQVTADPMASWSKVESMGDFLTYGLQDLGAMVGIGDYAVYAGGRKKGRSKTGYALGGLAPVWSHGRRLTEMWSNFTQFSPTHALLKRD